MPYTTLTASIAGKLSVNQKGASRADTRVIESMVNTGPERGVSYQLPGIVLLKVVNRRKELRGKVVSLLLLEEKLNSRGPNHFSATPNIHPNPHPHINIMVAMMWRLCIATQFPW